MGSFFLFGANTQTVGGAFNVKDTAYGALGDGAHDDTSNIQAAVTASGGTGVIVFPEGNYKTTAPITIPSGSSLSFVGTGIGSTIFGNFHGFIFDNISDPYNAAGAPSSIENLNISNSFVGNHFSISTGGTWSASGSPTDILLSGSNPGVAAGGALWVTGLGTNSVFIGMITSVASWPTVTVSSAAAGGGTFNPLSPLTAQIIQCYAAGGSFNGASPGTININSYTYNSGTGLVTLTLSATTSLSTNNDITVSGLNIAGLNGAFTVAAPVSASATVTYTAATGLVGSPSGGGSISWYGAAQITMAATRPAGIGTGLYYVYDYEFYLADPKYDFPLGVASWSGTTVTFTGTSPGAVVASVGSSDRLWFAPVAGCIRYSSVVGAKITNCFISGFRGVTSSQDKITAADESAGSSQGFHIVLDTCTMSNPSGFSGLMGQTGVYLTNNSISINCNSPGLWCAERLSGTLCGIIGGRAEVCHFATIIGGDFTTSNNSLSGGFITGRSMESNLLSIYCKGGSAVITSTGCGCFAYEPSVLGGFYLVGFAGVINRSGATGNFGTSYAMYIEDAGNTRGSISLISTYAINGSDASKSWRIPAQAWWGTCIQSDNPKLVYTYANLPGVSTNPSALEGDEFNISDGTDSLAWGVTVTNTGSHTTHYRVRYNGTNWTVMGK